MKIRNWLLFALVGISLAIGTARPSAAATITFDVNFAASGFGTFGTGTPVPLVLGSLAVTFDPSADVNASSNGTLNFLDPLTIASSIGFRYQQASDSLLVGGSESGFNAVIGGHNDFMLEILNFTSGSPTLGFLYYAQATQPIGLFHSESGLVHVDAVATTPIPAALPLFAAALGGLGFAGWRRRKSAAA